MYIHTYIHTQILYIVIFHVMSTAEQNKSSNFLYITTHIYIIKVHGIQSELSIFHLAAQINLKLVSSL